MDIILHIGAHKTATTHIQKMLASNRKLLAKDRITLSTPDDLRPQWISSFFQYCNNKDQKKLKDIYSKFPRNGTWILSEENISGTSYDFKSYSGIYPYIGSRLSCFKDLFKDSNIKLFFSIRSYETFYRSAYLEVIRNRGYIPFSEYYNEKQFQNNSWADLTEVFANIIPQDNITLWCYEDFDSIETTLLESMTGLKHADKMIATYNKKITRPSLSGHTVAILASLYPIIDQKKSRNLIERINKAYPISDKYPPFMAFDKRESERFKQQYKDDIKTIKENFPKINFL